MKTCDKCGAVMLDEDEVCSLCGEALPKKKKKSTPVILGVLAIIVLGFIIGIVLFMVTDSKKTDPVAKKYDSYETLVSDYLKFKAAGDYENMYALIAEGERTAIGDDNTYIQQYRDESLRTVSFYGRNCKMFVDEISKKEMTSQDIEEYEGKFKTAGYTVDLTEDNFMIADVNVTINGSKGIADYYENLMLYSEGGNWYILIKNFD